jgi:hypothetical protein
MFVILESKTLTQMTDEDRLTHLRSRFEECSKSSFEWKYSVGGVLLALPLCFALS